MSELKDSVIKLFGQTIPLSVLKFQQQHQLKTLSNDLSAYSAAAAADDDDGDDLGRDPESSLREESSNKELQEEQPQLEDKVEQRQQQDKEHSGKQIIGDEQDQDNGSFRQIKEDLKELRTSSGNCYNQKSPSVDGAILPQKSPKEQSESSTSQEKALNKPDKILPCPRCNSTDTKFCYYNNYNVNQPRHFCKKCQRYWTAGGTMRNMAVGAGRRKNKSSSASRCGQIMISEALRRVQANGSSGDHNNPCFGNNETVFTFGSESPLFESAASVLNLSDKSQNCVGNGFHRPERRILVSGADNGDDHSSGSSITATNSSEKGGKFALQDVKTKNYQGSAPQVPYFPAPPWPYPWNTPMPPPGFYPSGFPASFYPETTDWGAFPGHWNNIPCLPPTLGKHSRDGNIITPANSEKEEPSRGSNNSERTVSVPKTLRIDDPSEAANSCIWATLGIKNERTTSGEGLFKGFQSKSDYRNYIAETSAVLPANPAALSRSLNFHERT